MNLFKEQLSKCKRVIDKICIKINKQGIPSNKINYTELFKELYILVPLIPNEYSILRKRLRDIILPNLKLKDFPMINPYGIQEIISNNGINPYTYGEVTATINYLQEIAESNIPFSIWDTIHPQILSVSKERFENGHYADAVEAAFKEINSRVKHIYKERTSTEKDGHKLMQAAFSSQNPIIKIGDITNETGANIQQGYMEIFAGAIMGIRNPQAHNNLEISQSEAISTLHFASMLMYKIDNELK